MRVAVLGGTRFIGAAVIEELLDAGHETLVVHRGETERDDLPHVPHAHLHRHDTDALAAALRDYRAEALVDTCAYTAADADRAIAGLLPGMRTVVLSSQDVYRAFHTLRAGRPATDAVPLDEQAPLRAPTQRYLFRDVAVPAGVGVSDTHDYENLDVEERYLRADATVLRLPMVYGERDPMVREGFVLGRLAAGRTRIPIGAGNFLWTKGYVRDIATAIRLAVENDAAAGQAINIGERHALTMAQWARAIAEAAGTQIELVRVLDATLPEDLAITGAIEQHIVTDCARARELLGWRERPAAQTIAASVAWHLRHRTAPQPDLDADDAALAAAIS